MKLEVYYIVYRLSDGESCRMIAGPFSSYNTVFESDEYEHWRDDVNVNIVSHIMEVEQ
jgi:transcription antitermination factor NusG